MGYRKLQLDGGKWVITSDFLNYEKPTKTPTFAIDTENIVLLDGKAYSQKVLLKKLIKLKDADKRRRVISQVWAWQAYDEYNGFFMTNDFLTWLDYQARCRYMFGWCYNATFDFAQIDYQLLAEHKDLFKPHVHGNDTKGQSWTYESLNNDMGARYAYKIWVPYRNENRHIYTHAVEYRDFMKLVVGGLKNLLQDMNVCDNDGNPIRKLTMDYQNVAPTLEALTDDEIRYCENDVKGLYFAVKQFNCTIEQQSNNESHIFGKDTNIMTSGGFAKRELLRSMYPNLPPHKRLKAYQRAHPLTPQQDAYLREKYLYRGGISYINKDYQGKLIHETMYRYDVNSEYPYSMAMIRDLIGTPRKIRLSEWLKMPHRDEYECAYLLTSVSGAVKDDFVGLWYNPFKKEYQDVIEEEGEHLIFERELLEISLWYDDFTYTCEYVIIWKRGGYAYRPFILENYTVKEKASKEKNKTLKTTAKLKINASYGKLAERLTRTACHYELNEETGAIHVVKDGEEDSSMSAMNVAVGALVTAYARTFILGKIREITQEQPRKYFIYIDTDSVHSLKEYNDADAFKLGGLKCEMVCDACKYLLPKTYVDVGKIKNGRVGIKDFEIHSKGINTFSILKKFKGKTTSLKVIDKAMSYGAKYQVLVAMNVKGGKVLLPMYKELARKSLMPTSLVYSNADGAILIER